MSDLRVESTIRASSDLIKVISSPSDANLQNSYFAVVARDGLKDFTGINNYDSSRFSAMTWENIEGKLISIGTACDIDKFKYGHSDIDLSGSIVLIDQQTESCKYECLEYECANRTCSEHEFECRQQTCLQPACSIYNTDGDYCFRFDPDESK